MAELCYVNGEFVDKENATISVLDHGLLYGDGVFEGIRVYDGYAFKLHEHILRLYKSACIISLKMPMVMSSMEQLIVETVRRSGLRNAYIRPIVTRGGGRMGISPGNCKKPTVIVIVEALNVVFSKDLYERGISAMVSTIRNHSLHGLPPAAKTLNYLTNIMARIQAEVSGAQEAIFLDENGYVSEGSVDNIFIVTNGVLITPPLGNCLPGITRNFVIELAQNADYALHTCPITLSDLYTADEVFLTGTASEIVPVVTVDGRAIGNAQPGLITKALRLLYAKNTGIPETGVAVYEH